MDNGEVLESLPHACQGIPWEDTSHKCVGMNYVDDVLLCNNLTTSSKRYHQLIGALIRLVNLITQLDVHGIALKASKSDLCVAQLKFLGFEVSALGLQASSEKLSRIRDMLPPDSPAEIRTLT